MVGSNNLKTKPCRYSWAVIWFIIRFFVMKIFFKV
jgi:hypothetical protein